MLIEIDRVQVATPDAASAAAKWRELVGAEEVGRDRVGALHAKRTTLRVGTSDVELLEPDGEGIVARELKRRGRAHLFGGGASSPDAAKVARHAVSKGAEHITDGAQHYLRIVIEGAPLYFVISPPATRKRAGEIDFLYEVTVLAKDQAAAVKTIQDTFALDPTHFTTITSELFGYTGVLTLFKAGQLHRFEVITPTDMTKTLGRFHQREGASFYMAFGESATMAKIEATAKAANAGHTVDRPPTRAASKTADQLWLHPPALGGMMLGISRPTMAWRWSGHPERVVSID